MVAEHSAPVKSSALEVLGYYLPARNPKVVEIKKDRVSHWISKGAKPSDSVAVLLKKHGMEGMDQYMEPRNKKRRKKGEEESAGAAPQGSAPAEKPALKEEAKAA